MNTWEAQFTSAATPAADFFKTVFAGNKDLYDYMLNPTGGFGDYKCHGCYAYLNADTTRPLAKNWSAELFRFTAAGSPGDELHWSYENRFTGTGLSTRMMTGQSIQVQVTDNFVRIVPEPPSVAVFAMGALGLLLRRQSR